MKLLTITLLTTCTLLCGCCGSDCGTADASLDYAAINAQAAEQYLRPIRPGYEGRNPFWNGFAKKFIYAPAFDFDEVAGAANYRFTVVPLGEETQASWSFTADSPKAALTPVWGEIPVGRVRLTVEGLDASGKALGKAGERTMAATNRRLYPAVVTVMLFTPPDVADISSSTVREVLAFGRSVAEFLPRGIELENYL